MISLFHMMCYVLTGRHIFYPFGMITKSMSCWRDETDLITHTGGPDFPGLCYICRMAMKVVKLQMTMQWGCTKQPTGDPMQMTCIAGKVLGILTRRCRGRIGECANECHGNMSRKQMLLVHKMLHFPEYCCKEPGCQEVKRLARHDVAKFGRGTYVCHNGVGAYFCAECLHHYGISWLRAYEKEVCHD